MKQVLILLCLAVCAVLPPNTQAQDDELWSTWSYPYNDSTQRTYTPHLARIKYIFELGNDAVEYDAYDNPTADTIVLNGDVDEGEIIIERLHPTCWYVKMTSDYSLLRKTWKAKLEDGSCYELRLPMVIYGT